MQTLFLYIKNTGFVICGLLALYLLNPFNYGYAFGYIIATLVFINGRFLSENMDMDLFLLFLFSVIYALFYSFEAENTQGKQFIAIYAITPPFFYLLGKFLVRHHPTPKVIFYVLFGIGCVFSISAVISVLLNFLEGGFTQTERTIDMFWTNEPVSATVMGAFLTFNMCIPALIISSQGKNGILFNAISIGVFILSLICVLRLGSRTQLGIFILTTILSLFYIVPKQSLKKNIILMVLIAGVMAYILKRVSFDFDADWLTTFSDRMSNGSNDIASGGGRTERWSKSFRNLFEKPLGWDLDEFGYSHNMWLDTLRVSGIIPFIILIIYSIRSFRQIKRTINLKTDFIALNAQILIYGTAFFLLFMVEPVMEGIFSFFVLFCIFKGVINKYYVNSDQ